MIWALLLATAVPEAVMPVPPAKAFPKQMESSVESENAKKNGLEQSSRCNGIGSCSGEQPLDYVRLLDEAVDGGRIIQADAMLAQWRANAQPADSPLIDIATARIALEKRQNTEALARFLAVSQAGAANCRVDEGLGIALVRLGRAPEAQAPLRRAVAACADRWRAWNGLAIVYDQAQSWALSSAAYEHAFQLTDQPAQILNNYGLSLLKQGQAEKAAVIFDKAREIAPDDSRITTNGDAATVLSGRDIQRRSGESADEWAQRLSNAGKVALQMGDRSKAKAYLSQAMTEADTFMREAAATLTAMDNGKP